MPDIIAASRAQGLRLRLQVLGPFFRVRAEGEDGSALGRAEGVVRPWVAGKVLHLDSMRLSRDTLSMDRSIFGLGLFVGAAAVRHGYDQGCRTAQLLAINDSPLFHSKVRICSARISKPNPRNLRTRNFTATVFPLLNSACFCDLSL